METLNKSSEEKIEGKESTVASNSDKAIASAVVVKHTEGNYHHHPTPNTGNGVNANVCTNTSSKVYGLGKNQVLITFFVHQFAMSSALNHQTLRRHLIFTLMTPNQPHNNRTGLFIYL